MVPDRAIVPRFDDQFLLVHADSCIGNGEGLLLLIQFQVDPRRIGNRLVRVVHQRQVAQLVERVRGVRDQFAQKNFRMRVKGMNDQLQELIDFSLEFTLGHGYLSPNINIKRRLQPIRPRLLTAAANGTTHAAWLAIS